MRVAMLILVRMIFAGERCRATIRSKKYAPGITNFDKESLMHKIKNNLKTRKYINFMFYCKWSAYTSLNIFDSLSLYIKISCMRL